MSMLSLLLAIPACGPNLNPIPPAVCPDALHPPVPVPPAAPTWQRSGKASLELSLRGLYVTGIIKDRIRSLFNNSSSGSFAPELQSVTLEENQANGRRLNLARVRFSILTKNPDGSTTPLPGRNYTMLVEVYPQLVTPATMPDANLRRTLLQCGSDPTCGTNGVILNFYYSELDGGPNFPGTRVDCHATAYDSIDQAVLTGAYQIGSIWAPIPIPLDGVLQFVTDMTQVTANVVAVDFGTDQDVKLAVQLDKGSPSTFDPTFTQFSHFPDSDWLLSVDTSLLSSSISANVTARMSQLDPAVTPSPPVISFTPSGIILDGSGTKPVGICGNVRFVFQYTATTKVCSRNGKSVFSLCVINTQPPTIPDAGQAACVGIGSFLSSLFTSGLATAIITTPCQEKGYLNLQLAQDTLYITRTDLDNQFLIIGRSQMMDAANPGRPAMPQPCP